MELGFLERLLNDRLQVLADVLARRIADQLVLLRKQFIDQVMIVCLVQVGCAFRGGF